MQLAMQVDMVAKAPPALGAHVSVVLSQLYGSGAGVGGGVGAGVGMMQLAMQVALVAKAPPALGAHV
jgi:hypothetical protein